MLSWLALTVAVVGALGAATGHAYGRAARGNAVTTSAGPSLEPDGAAKLWVRRYDGPVSGVDTAAAVGVSPDGSKLFVTGASAGSDGVDYNGPGKGIDQAAALAVSPDGSTVYVTGGSAGSRTDVDYATIAYDASSGTELWVSRYDGPASASDSAAALGVSSDGSMVFVTGESTGAGGPSDYATVAYDASTGAELWVSRYDGPANSIDSATALTVSPDDSRVFVTGQSQGVEGADYATIGYDASSGAQEWVGRYNSPGECNDLADAVRLAPDGSTVFVTGASFACKAASCGATIAYDASSGALLWVRSYTEACFNTAVALGVTPDGSTVFATGYGIGRGTNYDYLTVAYDASTGALLWSRRYNGPASENDEAAALGVSPDGSKLFVTGQSYGPSGSPDSYTIAYAASGEKLWASRYNGRSNGADAADALGVSPNGSAVFVTGGSYRASSNVDYLTIAYAAG
jgi:PQQ-like domain